MTKSSVLVYLNYEKNNKNIYTLEILNKDINNENNELIYNINKQLLISYELYNICIDKIKYDELNKIRNDEIEILKKQYTIDLEKNNEKILNESDKLKYIYEADINNLKQQLIMYDKLLLEEKENKNKMYEFYNSMSNKIDNIDKYFSKNTTTSISGELGEEFIFNYILSNLELSNANLKKVNGKSNACDILLQYNNLNCCIESKNHSTPITQAQIKRFLTTDLNNPNYNSGIFISLKTDFADINNIKHFDIKYENNKPSIFLSKFIMRPNDIILAIKILDFIIYNQKFNTSDVNKYITLLKNNIDTLHSIMEINLDNIKNLNKSNTLIKNKQIEIEDLLNINKANIFICEICNKEFKKKINLTKHLINCK